MVPHRLFVVSHNLAEFGTQLGVPTDGEAGVVPDGRKAFHVRHKGLGVGGAGKGTYALPGTGKLFAMATPTTAEILDAGR